MQRNIGTILSEVESYTPEDGNWLPLDDLLAELWAHTPSTDWVLTLLTVFERFPGEDGAGVFWSIVHGLETIPGYEAILEESHSLKPAEFKSIMLRRIANT